MRRSVSGSYRRLSSQQYETSSARRSSLANSSTCLPTVSATTRAASLSTSTPCNLNTPFSTRHLPKCTPTGRMFFVLRSRRSHGSASCRSLLVLYRTRERGNDATHRETVAHRAVSCYPTFYAVGTAGTTERRWFYPSISLFGDPSYSLAAFQPFANDILSAQIRSSSDCSP